MPTLRTGKAISVSTQNGLTPAGAGLRDRRPAIVADVRVGLTGGIGSGKSTVAAGLVKRGGLLVDADAIARQVVEPTGRAFAPVVDRFGGSVVGPDGRLDRNALAKIVFNDKSALSDLNRITHPAIRELMEEQAGEAETTAGDIVILDVPLLDLEGKARLLLSSVIVVDVPTEMAISRLVAHRGFDEADARARSRAQMSREERLSLADLVVDNSGSRDDLESEIDRVWSRLVEIAAR